MISSYSKLMSNTPALHLLELLNRSGPSSRSQLAEQIGLSRAALTNLSRQLLNMDLVREVATEQQQQRQGRPSILLDLNPDYGYFVGVRIDESPLLMVLTDLKGKTVATGEVPLSVTVEGVVTALQQGVQQLVDSARISKKRVLGLGIAVSGVVDHTRGICKHSALLGWHDVPIADMVAEATGIPTYLENDANAVATGEKLFETARRYQNFSVVTFGRGIGGAHYIGGELYRGHNGGAGEIAHCTIDPEGLPCKCGKRGCLDTVASEEAVLQAARERGLNVHTLPELENLAAIGNPDAINNLKRAGHALGLAISHVININNPEAVCISGIDTSLGTLLMTSTRQTIENLMLPRQLSSTKLEFRQVNGEIWARGAASIAAHSFLTGKQPNVL